MTFFASTSICADRTAKKGALDSRGRVVASALAVEIIRQLCVELFMPMSRPAPIGEDQLRDLKVHKARQAVQDGEIHFHKVKSENQLAKVLTKALPDPLFPRCLPKPKLAYGAKASPAQAERLYRCRRSSQLGTYA